MQFWQLAHGNRTALIEGTRTLSYDQLGGLADTLAMHLPAGTKYSDQPADQRMEFPPVICGEKRRFDQQPSPKRGAWLFVGNRMPASHV